MKVLQYQYDKKCCENEYIEIFFIVLKYPYNNSHEALSDN